MKQELSVGINSRNPLLKTDELKVVNSPSHALLLICLRGFKDRAYPEITKKTQTIGGPE
jgi:hypothetical protein